MSLIRCSRRSLVSSSERLSWAATESDRSHQKQPALLPACGVERQEGRNSGKKISHLNIFYCKRTQY